MKKFLNLFFVCMVLMTFSMMASQSISVTQDVKLAVFGDDIGNDAFTPNIRAKVMLGDEISDEGVITPVAGIVYEYADLNDVYHRYGLQGGIDIQPVNNLFITPTVGFGQVIRSQGSTFNSLEGDLQTTYYIFDNLGITTQNVLTERQDNGNWVISNYLGLKYLFDDN